MSFYVAIEGIDGTGKTTLTKALHRRFELENWPVVTTREPMDKARVVAEDGSRLPIREEIEAFMKDRELHMDALVRPALLNDMVVVSDRCYLSNLAYQGAVCNLRLDTPKDAPVYDPAQGISVASMMRAQSAFLINPNLIVLLQSPLSLSLGRITDRGGVSEFEQAEQLARVSFLYSAIVTHYFVHMVQVAGHWLRRCDSLFGHTLVMIVDAAQKTEDLQNMVYTVCESMMKGGYRAQR